MVKQFVVDFTSETYKPLMEHEVNGLDYRYVYSDKARLSVVVQGIENGSASVLDSSGELHAYYHCDYLGTTDYLTSAVNSKVISWTSYNEWGEITHNAVLKCGQRELDLVKEYATHDFDAVLNQYYAKARFYDADNRRFTAVDPIKDGLNWYTYCTNNPVMWLDPWGLNPTNELIHSNAPTQWLYGEYYIQLRDFFESSLCSTPANGNSEKAYYNPATNTAVFNLKYDNNSIRITARNGNDGTVYLNGKNAGTIPLTLRNGNYYTSKNKLLSYFKKLWCEEYYIDTSTENANVILAAIDETISAQHTAALNNALAQARNYIISGVAVNSSSITASVSIGLKKMSMQEDVEEWLEFAVDALSLKYPLAGIVWEAAKDDAGGTLEVTASTLIDIANKKSHNEAFTQANAISELLSYVETAADFVRAIKKSDNPNYIVTVSTIGENDYIYYEDIISPNGQVLGSAGQYGKTPPTPAYYNRKSTGGVLWISDVTDKKIGGGSYKYTY